MKFKTKKQEREIAIRQKYLEDRPALMHVLAGLQGKFYVIDSIVVGSTTYGGICFHHGEGRGEQQFVHQVVEAFIPERYGATRVNIRTQMYSLDGYPFENVGQFDKIEYYNYGSRRRRSHKQRQEFVINEFTLEEFLERAKLAQESFRPKY